MNKIFYQTIREITSTGHWMTDQISLVLKEDGITEPQFNVLRILRGAQGEPLSVQTILERMVHRSSNITRIVDKLLKIGYVKRMECPSNRRKVDITITAEGLEALRHLDKKVEALHQPLMDNLNEKELTQLKELIIKLKTII